jgi:hypothetical protein
VARVVVGAAVVMAAAVVHTGPAVAGVLAFRLLTFWVADPARLAGLPGPARRRDHLSRAGGSR